ncbi:MAG: FliM/FliN family flagellar motor switch protein, partial [Rhodocyclaceae bacterium]|nr:FliM/FliN family flagellar motor switch protein [Rhodocyclaceae bacterium]
VFEEYEKAWKPVYEAKFEYIRSEMNTQFANIATPSEVVIAFTFTLELSGNSAEMHVCLPYSMIEPIRDLLYSTMHSEQAGSDKRWSGTLRRQLLAAEVELVAPLGGAKITLGEVAHLQVGDIVPIDIAELVNVRVDGIPLMNCRYGVTGGQYALKVEQFVAQEEAAEVTP